MSLLELDVRYYQSEIPSPVSDSGYTNHPKNVEPVVFDGTATTFFLMQHGGDWRRYKEFWRANQIGRVIDDLTPGKRVYVQTIKNNIS